MSEQNIPVEIKIWLPDHIVTRVRGTLRQFRIDNDFVQYSIGANYEYIPMPDRAFTLVGVTSFWKFDKHRVPQIGGKK